MRFLRSPRGLVSRTPNALRTRVSAPVIVAASVGIGALPMLTPSVARGANDLASMRLIAERTVLRADGRSTTVITAQVFDERGNVVADGTRVRFTTTAGRLDAAVAATQSGVARVTLTSADQPGDALVVAVLEAPGQSVPAKITISFSRDAEAAETGTAWAHVDASTYVGYILDYGVIHATGKNGGARFEYRGLVVTADTIQYNVRDNFFTAVGNVTLAQAGETRTFTHLRYSPASQEGVGERIVGDRPEVFFLKGRKLEEAPPAPGQFRPPSDTWILEDLSGAGITIVAKSILLEPGSRLQFRRATFYLDGNKTLSLPYHIMALGQDSLFREQIFGYGPQGVTIDFPFYYDVRPTGVGTLHMRRGARLGDLASSSRAGWSMDMVQTYSGGSSADGTVEVTGLTRSDWGARLRHGQRLDATTTGSVYVDLPRHRDLFVTTQVSRSYKTFHLNAAGSGSRAQGIRDLTTGAQAKAGGDVRGQLFAETFDRRLAGQEKLRYTVNALAARQAYFGSNAVAQGTVLTQTLGTRIFTTPLTIGKNTTYNQSVSIGQSWVRGSSGNPSGLSLLGTSTLNRSLGRLGMTSLSYDFTQTPLLSGGTAYAANGRHRLGLSVYLSAGENWSMNVTGSRGLDVSQSTLYGNMQFKIGGPWRGGVTLSSSRFAGVGYQEIEYALIRRIAGRDFAVYYSTTAKRFQLDLTGARF